MFEGQLFIILIVHMHTSSCVLDDIYDAGKQVWKLSTIIDRMELHNLHDTSGDETSSDSREIIREMESEIDKCNEQLKRIEYSMHSKKFSDTLKLGPLNAITFSKIDRFEIFISRIDEHYEQFQRSRETNESSHSGSYLDSADDIAIVRRFVTEGSEDSPPRDLPSTISVFAVDHEEEMCSNPQIISNIFLQLFRTVIIAEIKANIMMTFANIHRYIQESESRKGLHDENTVSRMLFELRFGKYVDQFLEIFGVMDLTYWRTCDPVTGLWVRGMCFINLSFTENYYMCNINSGCSKIKGKTFYEMEKTFQTTLFRYHWYNCKYDSCHDVMIHKSYQCKPKSYDYRSDCGEIITNCSYLSAIEACVLKKGPYRFQYVNSTKRGSLGTNFECPKDNGYMIRDGMGWNISYAACGCNCLSTHNKISLSIIESKVKLNRVIVGLRFVRRNRILHIQAKEARLNANGYINQYAQSWINIPNNIDPSLIHRIDKENRVFFFDDLRLPPSFVLTGVKFNKVTRGTVTGFALEIFGVHFDYKSGKLFLQDELRLSRRASNEVPGESLSFKPVNSIYSTLRNTVSSSERKYVVLQQSRLEEDFGQSTLPLFDATPITIHFPSALSGIGIFHKGAEGYAGFISLGVFGIKYEKYFQDFKFSHMKSVRVFFNDSNNQ